MDKNAKKQNVLDDEALDKVSGGKMNVSNIFDFLKNVIKGVDGKTSGEGNNDSTSNR